MQNQKVIRKALAELGFLEIELKTGQRAFWYELPDGTHIVIFEKDTKPQIFGLSVYRGPDLQQLLIEHSSYTKVEYMLEDAELIIGREGNKEVA